MGFFTPERRITEREFRRDIVPHLIGQNFSKHQIGQVKEIFHGDLMSKNYGYRGITHKELEEGVKWMHQNEHIHHLSKDQIGKVEEAMKKHL